MEYISSLISGDLDTVSKNEDQINELFQDQIVEYKNTKAKLKSLEESKNNHTKKAEELTERLNEVTEELTLIKKKIDEKGASLTDNAPLVEIRTALQKLRAENKELDVRIGVLVSCMSAQMKMLTDQSLLNFICVTFQGL